MKIGIIIYSFTGNTKLVAERVAKRLVSDGHEVDLIFIEPNESIDLKAEEVVIKKIPDISRFDTLVLGTPVHGGRMSAPMRYFLNQIKTLEGFNIVFIVTHFFRRGWGSVQALQSLRKLCELKGGEILGSVDIKWLSFVRNREIQYAVDRLGTVMTANVPIKK